MSEILLVDDDPRLREMVRYTLARAGYTVREAADGREALAELARKEPDLVVLDVLMPGVDGLEVCRELRKTSRVPLLFLSSKDEELDKVLGLELGGDDYVTKPFSPKELVSRVRALLRRSRPVAPAEVVEHNGLRLDAGRQRAWVGEHELTLTLTQFRMLRVLMSQPGRALSRQALMEQTYEGQHYVSDRTLDSHVRHLRAKLAQHGAEPIETVYGLGYRWRE